jgi:hypothetical protein
VLYVGLAFFLSGAFPAMPDCINDLTGTMLDGASAFMHCLTSWTAAQPWSHLEGLSLTWIQVVLLYAIGILMFHYLENKAQRVQQWLGILVICYLGFSICREFRILTHRGIYVFALKGESAIAFVEGRNCYLSADYCRRDSILPYGMESFFHYYTLKRPVCIDSGEETSAIMYRFDDKRILVLNALEGCSLEGLPALDGGPVVLRNNPEVDIHELEKKCHPGIIVADGSNRYYYIRRMESNCREAGIEFHSTRSDGYFVY